jgi:hypothetical protein
MEIWMERERKEKSLKSYLINDVLQSLSIYRVSNQCPTM